MDLEHLMWDSERAALLPPRERDAWRSLALFAAMICGTEVEQLQLGDLVRVIVSERRAGHA